ncbi:CLUMA_CG003237, isoform A [Clunio marinus]|uniref:CLUMA_CG003237, isoform A n=1 Tax=Clunio marinus TaxID=568069 RepID=A0A1J1HPZ6_9DIPT|nr:CLUMA_CG003237, isoform A [Clunio marinus]
MLSRLVTANTIIHSSVLKSALQNVPRRQILRTFAEDAKFKTRAERINERMSLKERAMAPAGPNAFAIGKGALVGGSAIGLGALCFYGLGLGSGTNTLHNSHLWPEFVKQRIRDTYMYFGASIAISAGSAYAVFRTPALLNLVSRSGWLAILATFAVMIGSGMVAQSIPYSPGFGAKQLAWMTHSAIIGAVVAPLCFVGGPIMLRAAWYTAGVVGGLSTIAVCAPSEKFLTLGGPLAMGLGAVFAASIASSFLPATTALGAGLYSISLYGGLLLFSGFLLYDTQKIIKRAENQPLYGGQLFDPVNNSISIYLDTLNIFIRIVSILAGGGSRRK